MKWYTVFNSRTKFSDYRNMAPLPQMSEQAMQCFRQKRLEAQNGSINPTVYAVVTAKDVLLFRILLTGQQDQYGRDIRCAEGLYGSCADMRREWENVVTLATGLWNKPDSWYTQVVQDEHVAMLTPEQAIQSVMDFVPDTLPGTVSPRDMIAKSDAICCFTIGQNGIQLTQSLTYHGRTVWQPTQKQQEYKIICHIEKTERQAWMEAVDCKHGKQSMVRSEYIAMTQNGYPVKKMQQAAQTLRDYMEEQGWREAP